MERSGRFTLSVAMLVGTAAAIAQQPAIIALDHLPGATQTIPLAVTPDGSVVVGRSGPTQFSHNAFKWRPNTGMVQLPIPFDHYAAQARAVTDDGATVIGFARFTAGHHPCGTAFRWTTAGYVPIATNPWGAAATVATPDGTVIAGELLSCVFANTYPFRHTSAGLEWLSQQYSDLSPAAISSDGSILAGGVGGIFSFSSSLSPPAWRWTAATGFVFLDPLPGTTGCSATAMTRDGSIIAGPCFAQAGAPVPPFRWSESGGTQPLPMWPNAHTTVNAMSDNGSIIVGNAVEGQSRRAVAWVNGSIVDLNVALAARGVNLIGWMLEDATGINPAGDVIIGTGRHNGSPSAFVAYLGCYANCNSSTVEPILNVEDFICFLDHYAEALALPHEQQTTHYANCDQSTTPPVLDINDFICFINHYATGCP